jgi:hypothetical protein
MLVQLVLRHGSAHNDALCFTRPNTQQRPTDAGTTTLRGEGPVSRNIRARGGIMPKRG